MTEKVVGDYEIQPKPAIDVQFGARGATDPDLQKEQG